MIGLMLRSLCRLLHRRPPVTPRQDYAEAISVGTCNACDGPVLYSRVARLASCACGATLIPRSMLDPHDVARSAP